jgi:hypothetical protein
MGVSLKEAPADITNYNQCQGKDSNDKECKEYQNWLLKKNWARHIREFAEFHAGEIKAGFKLDRETCDICDKPYATGTYKRHAASESHKRNAQRQAQSQSPTASDEEQLEQDKEDEAEIGLQNLSVNDRPRNRIRSAIPDATLQEEVYTATEKALRQSIKAVEAYNDLPKLSTSEVQAATGERPPKLRKRHGGQRKQLAPAKSRAAYETPFYLQLLKKSTNIYPLGPDEYRRSRHDGHAMKRAYIVCRPMEARKLLEEACPRVPILVRADQNGHMVYDDLNTIESFLVYIASKPTKVEIHRYNGPINDPDFRNPKPTKPTDAITLFLDAEADLVNFLNLGNVKDNPVPYFMVGIRALKILKEITEDGLIGKREVTTWSDLSSCCAFHILAKAGVFSLPHVDHHGVITTATCDEGEKYWLTWPELTDVEMEAWAADECEETYSGPAGVPFGIYLRPGDVLIQPRGRVHAPYSKTNVLMSGTMHMDSRDMVGVLRSSLFERRNDGITNELPAKQFTKKMLEVDRLWKAQNPSYPWGTGEQYEEWSKLMKVCSTLSKPIVHADTHS